MDNPASAHGSLPSGHNSVSSASVLPRPKIVGIFGIPGSGKTFLWKKLLEQLGEERYKFFEGSQVIAGVCPGGLDVFKASSEADKLQWRQLAVTKIRDACAASDRVGVVVGHFMFWDEDDASGQIVLTESDWDTFTHILYLDVPTELIEQRRRDDSQRSRRAVSPDHLHRWQEAEKAGLRRLCGEHGILFCCVSPGPALLGKVTSLLHDFRVHNEVYNHAKAVVRLEEIFAGRKHLETALVLDGDRTLIAEDTGELFAKSSGQQTRPRDIFSGPLGYSYTAFRQAMLLYEEAGDAREFKRLCYRVASEVKIHPDFLSLLDKAAEEKHVGAVVITSGLGYLWEIILEMHDLHRSVQVIGGGRVADNFVVTAAVKARLAEHLGGLYKCHVWAFGDSPLDLPMLRQADEAIVVVREEALRSKSMDKALLEAIDTHGLHARQLLLPGDVVPRLDVAKLPVVQLDEAVLNSVFGHGIRRDGPLQVIHESESNAVKMLTTPTRDAKIRGPGLREAHRHVGRYLALRCLSEVVGVEEHPIPHVQGHQTSGFRLRDAHKTCIVALMRGGEPMAMGVSDVVPEAMFLHATDPKDVTACHLEGQSTVFLVDSVVNSGASVVRFYERIRGLKATIRTVVVAGVVQAQCVSNGGLLHALGRDAFFDVVALRLSNNAFTGQGGTDTGNRLFNTTHLP